MSLRTIWWSSENRAIGMIDQTLLPERLETIEVELVDELCEAIISLRVRGPRPWGRRGLTAWPSRRPGRRPQTRPHSSER